MARPKEKESASCNLKLEVGAKANLTELAEHFKTSRTKIVEDLVNLRHREVFSSAKGKADAVTALATQLLSAGIDKLQSGGAIGSTRLASQPAPGAPADQGHRRGTPVQSPKK